MGILEDAEKAAEFITNTQTPGASAVALIDWLKGLLQGALNAPNQHEKLQAVVNMLDAKKHDLAAAVAAEPANNTASTDAA